MMQPAPPATPGPDGRCPFTFNARNAMSRSSTLSVVLSALLVAVAPVTFGQGFPTKPVTLVVPYPPGGSADILARAVGQKLSDKLGQSVIVENKAGAGTAIGSRFVAESAPDGYTMLMGTVSSHAINPAMSKVGYDAVRDFATVAPLGSIPFVLVARPDAPYQTLADVIAAARREPGKIGYASAGPGTSNHLAGEMLASAAGVQLLHVPYKGSAPALTDVLGRPVVARAVPLEEMRAKARTAGLGDDRIEQMTVMNHHYDLHGMRGNPNVLRMLLGREPTTYRQYVERLARR
jgi:tripartite-type tricarboxylate transporter receptor subunit TctC